MSAVPRELDLNQLPSLTTQQHSLLLAALESNRRAKSFLNQSQSAKASSPQSNGSLDASDGSQQTLQPRDISSSSSSGPITFGDNLFPNFVDSNTNFDIDFPGLEPEMPNEHPTYSTADGINGDLGDASEKRKFLDDDEDDESDTENGKRREGEEKIAKKPGRKLITTEPTTKRKAQNRAAQRAFRDRKEKHVKDLELKVSDLEKVSDTTYQENSVLRAEIQRLQTELSEYKKRRSLGSNTLGTSPIVSGSPSLYSSLGHMNGHMSDFQFDFAKFGNTSANGSAVMSSLASNGSPHNNNMTPSTNNDFSSQYQTKLFGSQSIEPGIFGGIGTVDYSNTVESPKELCNSMSHSESSRHNSQSNQSRSTSSANSPGSALGLNGTSSCGTSPELAPNYNLDGGKSFADLTYDSSALYQDPFSGLASNQALYDFSNVDWLSQQSGGQFNPQLFGDYRESQAAVVGDGDFSSGFFEDPNYFGNFNDATTSLNPNIANVSNTVAINEGIAPSPKMNDLPHAPQPTAGKPAAKLMEQVARCRDGETGQEPGLSKKDIITTNKLWSELTTCPKFLAGDLDIDYLCSELSAKATCSETGMTVPKEVVEQVLWRLVGVPAEADKLAAEQIKAAQRKEMADGKCAH